ncbi:MAG: VWA domain-containing protein [Burkholderiaceae bacterium]|nr:VWA domain-containing protein [Burkholderiaceae bacterium]
MEEWVGQQWHRFITRAAAREHAQAAVALPDMARAIGMLFRAGGGPGAVRLSSAAARRVGGTRGWLQRVAGSGTHAELPRLEAETLALPARIAVFPDAELNRALYLWLAALAASQAEQAEQDEQSGPDTAAPPSRGWIAANLRASERALQRFPGLRARHARLVEAQLALRPDPHSLRGAAAEAERAVQAALRRSIGTGPAPAVPADSVAAPADTAAEQLQAGDVAPVWLWLDFAADGLPAHAAPRQDPGDDAARDPAARAAAQADRKRRHAEEVRDERHNAPLVMFFRAESILSWGDFVKVNRASDEDENPDALAAADDMEVIAVAPDGERAASRVKFDLDLPSAAADDRPLGPGIRLPEWDWKRRSLQPEHCSVQCLIAQPGAPFLPSPELRATARRVRRRLEVLRAAPRPARAQPDGEEIDLDAWVRHQVEGGAGSARQAAPAVYTRQVRSERSLATLLLADLSLSTDAYVWHGGGQTPRSSASSKLWKIGRSVDAAAEAASAAPEQRVVDIIREALYVFGEALHAGGDPFEMLGFSSVRRQNVRIQHLKGFDEGWSEAARARVGAIKPGYYTRMGAALRYATLRLAERPERQRLLLILTDGKPNDLDVYEGRYGLEDTRHAVQSARDAGLTPFCVTIDEAAHDYLPMLFGQQGYALVHRPQDLVHRLAQVYAGLTK